MIKLRPLICEIIAEKMSYQDLMNSSDPARIDRGSRIPSTSLAVKSINDKEAWKFSYKTPRDENTTGRRHQGFIYFFKDNMNIGDNAMKIPCSVDCSCPDYKFRFSYANKQQDAGENGPNSLNKGLNYPSSINKGPGLCKHLISLKEYLRTHIEPQPDSSNQHQTIQPPKGTPVVIPKTTKQGEEDPTKVTVDPTQTPKPEKDLPDTSKQVDDPTQTPQEPDNDQKDELPTDQEPVVDPNKKEKLKEFNNNFNLAKSLDEFCKKFPIFIIK
jgi:hypothetical protein